MTNGCHPPKPTPSTTSQAKPAVTAETPKKKNGSTKQ